MFLKPRQSRPQYFYKVYSYKKNRKEKKRVYKNNSKAVNQCNAVIAGWAHSYFLDSFKANHANKVTLIIMHISVLSSATQQCMENESSHATAIVIPLPIVAY